MDENNRTTAIEALDFEVDDFDQAVTVGFLEQNPDRTVSRAQIDECLDWAWSIREGVGMLDALLKGSSAPL